MILVNSLLTVGCQRSQAPRYVEVSREVLTKDLAQEKNLSIVVHQFAPLEIDTLNPNRAVHPVDEDGKPVLVRRELKVDKDLTYFVECEGGRWVELSADTPDGWCDGQLKQSFRLPDGRVRVADYSDFSLEPRYEGKFYKEAGELDYAWKVECYVRRFGKVVRQTKDGKTSIEIVYFEDDLLSSPWRPVRQYKYTPGNF